MTELKNHHEEDLKKLKLRLGLAERQAKSDMNSEVEKLLHEFEQSEHTHTQKLADLQKIHHEQLSVMKQDQQAEIQHHLKKRAVSSMIQPDSPPDSTTTQKLSAPVRKVGGSSSKILRWPAMGSVVNQPELVPKDPKVIHVYISSISANSAVKRNQESIQSLLTSCNLQYETIDVARREPALQHMRRQTSGKTLQLPLIFVGGQYKGVKKHSHTHTKSKLTLPLFLFR
jgi:glutaredoxin